MTNFERVTASPEALAACLETIVCADSPWDAAFRRHFCDGCGLANCDEGQGCPHQAERNNPAWWLALDDSGAAKRGVLEKMLEHCGGEDEKVRAAKILKAVEGMSVHAAREMLEGCREILLLAEIHYK